jgi:hypothetical protein
MAKTQSLHRDNVESILRKKELLKPGETTDDWWLVFYGDHVEVSVDVTPKGGVTSKKVFWSSFDGRDIRKL